MKRWVWLGLVGLLAACKEEPAPPVQDQDCTTMDPSGQALPPESTAQASDESTVDAQGREAVLIRYRRTVSAASAAQAASDAVTRVGGTVKVRWASLGAVAARVTPQERAELARDPNVLAIEPDRIVHAFTRQALVSSGTVGEYTDGLKQVQAPDVWDANNDGVLDDGAPTGAGIRVCVIDSGWDNRHPELRAAYAGGKDFVDGDDEPLDKEKDTVDAPGKWGGGHGTHTAATIVAQFASGGSVSPGDEPNGVVGVAPGVELLVARVLNTKGNGSTSNIISALQWCQTQGAKIVSLSLGAPDPSTNERLAFEAAIQAGILPIAASGNSATGDTAADTALGVAYPAGYDGVLAVGAVNFASEHATFSQIGPELSLVAPGVDVLSAMVVGGDSYSQVQVDGKSFESRSLAFAPLGEYTGKMLTCGVGDSSKACGEEATCSGFVAYVDRGGVDVDNNGITFAKKVDSMRRAGARAVIIGNNDPKDGIGNFTLGSDGTWLPTAAVANSDVEVVKAARGKDAKVQR